MKKKPREPEEFYVLVRGGNWVANINWVQYGPSGVYTGNFQPHKNDRVFKVREVRRGRKPSK